MYAITRSFQWDSAHRVLMHESKCKFIHGHRYVAEVRVAPAGERPLDKLQRVIDFGVIKSEIGGWIDRCWDHNILLNSKDPMAQLWGHPAVVLDHTGHILTGDIVGEQQPYLFTNENPTAEIIAKELFCKAVALMQPHFIWVLNVRVYETPNCWADYSYDRFREESVNTPKE